MRRTADDAYRVPAPAHDQGDPRRRRARPGGGPAEHHAVGAEPPGEGDRGAGGGRAVRAPVQAAEAVGGGDEAAGGGRADPAAGRGAGGGVRRPARRARPGGCTSPSSATPVSNGCSRCWSSSARPGPTSTSTSAPASPSTRCPRCGARRWTSSSPPTPRTCPTTDFTPLFDYEPVFVASAQHPLAAKAWIEAEDFRDETLITYPVDRARLDVFTELLTPPRWSRPRSGRWS